MTEEIKDSFTIYHSLDKRKLVSKIRKLEKRITEIEKKQAERYPNLIGRIGRMENSFPTLVERLDRLEKKLSTTFKISCKRLDSLENELLELKEDTHTHTVYAGTAVPVTKDSAEGGSW